jgi:hypothetical protein
MFRKPLFYAILALAGVAAVVVYLVSQKRKEVAGNGDITGSARIMPAIKMADSVAA